MRSFNLSCLVMILFVCSAVGCGGSGNSLSGKATFDGKPIPYGDVTFTPDEGNEGPTAVGEIRDGAYKTVEGEGVGEGAYVVNVNGRTTPTSTQEGELFPGYQAKLDVTKGMETFDIDVPASAAAKK